jgi:hypothetical protein
MLALQIDRITKIGKTVMETMSVLFEVVHS